MATTTETHTITVNGEEREVPVGTTVPDILRTMEIDPDYATGVAVAVDREVIPRQEWGDVALEEGDDVEVVRAQQGG